MLTTIPDNSITLVLQRRPAADAEPAGGNRHWLLPARKDMAAETATCYGAGDRLLKLKVS